MADSGQLKMHANSTAVVLFLCAIMGATPCNAEPPEQKTTWGAECDKLELFEFAACMDRASTRANPPAAIPDAKPPTQILRDCMEAKQACSGRWRGIELLIGDDALWFTIRDGELRPRIKWVIECAKDRFSDRKWCEFHPDAEAAPFFIRYTGEGPRFAVLTNESPYPGSRAYARVDQKLNHSTVGGSYLSVAETGRLMAGMRSGRLLATRYFDWPYNHPVDRETELESFSDMEAIAAAFASRWLRL